MDNKHELLNIHSRQEMSPHDRKTLLTVVEHGVIGSGVSVMIHGKEKKIVDQVKSLEGDSMLIDEAYFEDPNALLTPISLLSQGGKERKEVIGGRAGKKVGGNIVMYGVSGVLASMQGVEMGMIPQDMGENNTVPEIHVYFSREGKQIQPSEIGADGWELTPSFKKILNLVMIDPSGTMIYTATPVSK